MGIHQFYHNWLKRQSSSALQNLRPNDVQTLFIDMNGIIHQTAALVYAFREMKGYKPRTYEEMKRESELEVQEKALKQRADYAIEAGVNKFNELLDNLQKEHFRAVVQKLITVIGGIKPKELLVISIDGSAPLAKIKQQRSRRYRSQKNRELTTRYIHGEPIYRGADLIDYMLPDNYKAKYKWPLFNSSAITPGTEFMIKLDEYLRNWLSNSPPSLPSKVIYYSHMVPGEGEHRIMDYIRDNQKVLGNMNGAHVIWGSDSDLALLASIAPINGIYIARDNIRDMINVEEFRKMIKDKLGTKTALNDFVFMFSFIGNDFLPRTPSMINFWGKYDQHGNKTDKGGIDIMINVYQTLNENNENPLVNDNLTVNWNSVKLFIVEMANKEKELLSNLVQDERILNDFLLLKQSTIVKRPPDIAGTGQTTILDDPSNSTIKIFDFNVFRSRWYAHIFLPTNYGKMSVTDSKLFGKLYIPNSGINVMNQSYFQGLGWINLYYNKGIRELNLDWFYIQEHAPLFSDMAEFMNTMNTYPFKSSYSRLSGQTPLNVVHQLLTVMPPQDIELIPLNYRKLMHGDSPITDMYPTTFDLDDNGLTIKSSTILSVRKWMAIPMLPPFQPERVIKAVQSIKATVSDQNKYEEGTTFEFTRTKETSKQVENIRKLQELRRNNFSFKSNYEAGNKKSSSRHIRDTRKYANTSITRGRKYSNTSITRGGDTRKYSNRSTTRGGDTRKYANNSIARGRHISAKEGGYYKTPSNQSYGFPIDNREIMYDPVNVVPKQIVDNKNIELSKPGPGIMAYLSMPKSSNIIDTVFTTMNTSTSDASTSRIVETKTINPPDQNIESKRMLNIQSQMTTDNADYINNRHGRNITPLQANLINSLPDRDKQTIFKQQKKSIQSTRSRGSSVNIRNNDKQQKPKTTLKVLM